MVRPKTISDEAVLDAVLTVLADLGPANLTFAAAAKAVGLSPATLVQRYGDRDRLLQAVLLRAWDKLDAATGTADTEAAETPDGAIDLLLALMPPETAESDMTDGLLLLREDMRDPGLRALGAAWGERLAAALGRRLSPDPEEAARLGWQMASLWQGAMIWWAFKREGSARQALCALLRSWCMTALPSVPKS